jgi:hypothetical protein
MYGENNPLRDKSIPSSEKRIRRLAKTHRPLAFMQPFSLTHPAERLACQTTNESFLLFNYNYVNK